MNDVMENGDESSMIADKDWTWHFILNRPHLHLDFSEHGKDPNLLEPDAPEPLPMVTCDDKYYHNKRTIGWELQVLRTEPSMFENLAYDSKSFISLDYARKLADDNPSADIDYDSEGNVCFESMEQAVTAPLGILKMMAPCHTLASTTDFRNIDGTAKAYMTKAIQMLKEKKYKGIKKGGGVKDDFNCEVHVLQTENAWLEKLNQRPRKIVLHILLPNACVSGEETAQFVKDIENSFPGVKVETNRKLTESSASVANSCHPSSSTPPDGAIDSPIAKGDLVELKDLKGARHLNGCRGRVVKYVETDKRWAIRLDQTSETIKAKISNIRAVFPRCRGTEHTDRHEKRLLWAYGLAQNLITRFNFSGEKSENYAGNNGNLKYGIDFFFRYGVELKGFGDKPFFTAGAYYHASKLLALRPWKTFAPFEILKVVVTSRGKETIRWVMFTAREDVHDGGQRSSDPFGSVAIQPKLSDLTHMFGRTTMYLQSGIFQRGYEDMIYVSADPIGLVHYDTIFLLTDLFGNSISPLVNSEYEDKLWMDCDNEGEMILEYGVIPNFEAQTGPPESYFGDSSGRSTGRRPLTEDELRLTSQICWFLRKFTEEFKLLGVKPNGGVFSRTYPSTFISGEDPRSETDESNTVKVEYNMDSKFGGIWDSSVKYFWFED